jgi:hypothetical protein
VKSVAPVTEVRASAGEFPVDITVQRRAPLEAHADAVMYRQVLSELAHTRDWRVHLHETTEVVVLCQATFVRLIG